METTQMRFKDLLVSDLGPLPADAKNNVALTTSTTHPASLMLSGVVGDRCDVRYRYSDGLTGKYHTAKSMEVLFGNLNRSAMTDIRVNDLVHEDMISDVSPNRKEIER